LGERHRVRQPGPGTDRQTPGAHGTHRMSASLPPPSSETIVVEELRVLDRRRLRRLLLLAFALAAVLVLLAPLTATDQADSLGVPKLVDRTQTLSLTTVTMFVVMASARNIVRASTGYT